MPLLFLGFFCLRKFTTSRTNPPRLTTNVDPFRRLTIPELGKPLCFIAIIAKTSSHLNDISSQTEATSPTRSRTTL
jgi:hypothetical protein